MKVKELYSLSKNNKIKYWSIEVEDCGHCSRIITHHGYKEGQLQTSIKEVSNGKNLGKANETSHYQQACLEAKSVWNKKKDKGYVEDSTGKSDIKLPMLAHDINN